MIITINDITVGSRVITHYDKKPWEVTKVTPTKNQFCARDLKGGVWTRIYSEEVKRIIK